MPIHVWKRLFSGFGTIIVVLILFVVFVFAVFWFRKPKKPNQTSIDSIAQVLTPDPISQTILNGAIDTESRTVLLTLVGRKEIVGEARRGFKDGQYFIELEAVMPEIDREVYFYEVWLLRPIPYDFFSVGEMITNEKGVFVLEWEGEQEKDYREYAEIVITRQQYDGSSDPGVHIVEAVFGK